MDFGKSGPILFPRRLRMRRDVLPYIHLPKWKAPLAPTVQKSRYSSSSGCLRSEWPRRPAKFQTPCPLNHAVDGTTQHQTGIRYKRTIPAA